jgi:alkylphenol/PAH-inducible cytochrome P450 monooxygenase
LWKDQLLENKPNGKVIAVNKWLSRMTLDIIGESMYAHSPASLISMFICLAAFQFEFGALDNSENEVSKAYDNMFTDSQLHPTTITAIFRATWAWWPKWLLSFVEYIPSREYQRFRRTRELISKVSTALVDNATHEAKTVEIEKGKKDVMSVLGECYAFGTLHFSCSTVKHSSCEYV